MQPRRHIFFFFFVSSCLRGLFLTAPALAQQSPAATRLAVLQAEDRRAATAADLAALRSALHSADGQTARVAVRGLGRLERPALIVDITPLLRHPLPEVRIEAATAIGQAAQGWKRGTPPPASAIGAALAPTIARL
jgi:HEAT repeat protein